MYVRHIRKSLLAAGAASLMALVAASGGASAGVVAHYSFDSDATTDSGGNGLNLNAAGSVGLAAGAFGSAADLDGGEYLWSGSSQFNIGSSDFALSFWYETDTSSGFRPLVGKHNSGLDQGYTTRLETSVIGGDLRDEVGGNVEGGRPANDGNAFQHVVFQRTASMLELYINGILADTDTVTSFVEATGSAFAVGARNISASSGTTSSGTLFFDGRIDELWVFDNALTGAQIANLRDSNSIEAAVPEPAGLALLGSGVLLLGARLRRRAR